jgi:hypothetical protein
MLLKQKEVSSIVVEPQSVGIRAVYIVEARNRQERKEIRDLFENIREVYEVRQLSDGTIMSYTVQITGDPSVLSEIENILKANFVFSILERSFNDTIYMVIQDLCADTGSRLCRIPRCGICGKLEPFPTRVNMLDDKNNPVMNANYCGRCVASLANRSEKKVIVDLLSNDRRNFSAIREVKLVKRGYQRKEAERPSATHTYRIAS